MADFHTPGRVKALRRVLLVDVVLAALMVPLSVLFFVDGPAKGGVMLLVIALVIGASAWFARRAVIGGADTARRLTVMTALLTIIFSLPLIYLLIGFLTVVVGVGLLFLAYSAEREAA